MKLSWLLIVMVFQLPLVWQSSFVRAEELPKPAAAQDDIEIFFSPRGGCTTAIVKELATAKETIDCQAYAFTSQPIADALAAAKTRGVKVRVILDHEQSAGRNNLTAFLDEKFPLRIDAAHAIAHNKVMVIDAATARPRIVSGSFNFTTAAEEHNAENVIILRNKRELAAAYLANFEVHWKHSHPRIAGK